jgi:hypothetical protein
METSERKSFTPSGDRERFVQWSWWGAVHVFGALSDKTGRSQTPKPTIQTPQQKVQDNGYETFLFPLFYTVSNYIVGRLLLEHFGDVVSLSCYSPLRAFGYSDNHSSK